MAEYKRLTKEEKLAKINVALSDAEMANAAGGTDSDAPEPKFQVGDHFRVDEYIDEGYVLSIRGYYGPALGWVYNCRLHDPEGWYENPECEFNMEPY